MAKAFFAVGSKLDLTWYLQQISSLPVENNWQALARESFRDDLDSQQRAITVSVLQMDGTPEDLDALVQSCLEQRQYQVERWRRMLAELRSGSGVDYAMYAVAGRELQDLALEKPQQ